MNANPIGWFCLSLAIGCLVVSGVAGVVYRLMDADRRCWFRTLATCSVMVAIAFVGVSIPTWITPDAAARFEFWLLHSQRPMVGPALWCFILAVVSVGIAVGASLAAIFSASGWIRRWQTVSSYARRAFLCSMILSIVFWNLG